MPRFRQNQRNLHFMQMPDATDQSDEDTGTGAKREG